MTREDAYEKVLALATEADEDDNNPNVSIVLFALAGSMAENTDGHLATFVRDYVLAREQVRMTPATSSVN